MRVDSVCKKGGLVAGRSPQTNAAIALLAERAVQVRTDAQQRGPAFFGSALELFILLFAGPFFSRSELQLCTRGSLVPGVDDVFYALQLQECESRSTNINFPHPLACSLILVSHRSESTLTSMSSQMVTVVVRASGDRVYGDKRERVSNSLCKSWAEQSHPARRSLTGSAMAANF